jgi:hypothetical protein
VFDPYFKCWTYPYAKLFDYTDFEVESTYDKIIKSIVEKMALEMIVKKMKPAPRPLIFKPKYNREAARMII